ncbi:hypothetical protein BpHYR1_047038 [Brachionus plicatilis]|uniref:Uncharacterized protein n=1 Tax=Brachionus plicatilis TaxID=10195 RepID=A0A3M7SQC2_BRAPC|nr:hypothetical protein BpHYR1_047038 [Brachionus plicatilis]
MIMYTQEFHLAQYLPILIRNLTFLSNIKQKFASNHQRLPKLIEMIQNNLNIAELFNALNDSKLFG